MGNYFAPVVQVSPIANYIISIVIIVLLLFTGMQKESPRLNVTYIILFGIGIVLSMLMAMIYHDQSLLGTAISQRPLYFMLCFFVWWKIGLTEDELFPILRVLTILTLFLFTISLFEPQLFMSQTTIEKFYSKQSTSTDVLCFMPGHLYVLLYLFYLLQNLQENFSRMDWLIVFASLGMFFIFQNRSTLIYLAVIMVYFLVKNRKRFSHHGRGIVVLSVIFVLLIGLPYIRTISESLITETQLQLEDDEYNRKIALQYYLFDYNEGSIVKMIFGNGQPTTGSDYFEDMVEGNEQGAYWSDLGFIGDWFLFGVIPIITLLIMAYKVFRYPYPQYLKYLFASFLLVPTIHTFSGNNMHVFYFSLVMYLVCLNEYRLKYQVETQLEDVADVENGIVENA